MVANLNFKEIPLSATIGIHDVHMRSKCTARFYCIATVTVCIEMDPDQKTMIAH